MAVTAKAQTQPINVVCNAPEIENYGTDIFFDFSSFDGSYLFRFDIYLAQGATDIVDGQTYTLSDMDFSYSYGVDYATYGLIEYQSVSFVRYADGSYVVDVTDVEGNQYHITYTRLTSSDIIDTVAVTMDNGRVNWVNDVTAKGVFQLFGADATNQYAMQLTVYSDQMAGTYTFDDIYSSLTYFYANGARVGINNVNDFTVTGDSTACSAYIEIIGVDSVFYQVTFSYPGVIHAISDTIDITMNSASNIFEDYISSMSLFRLHGYDQTGDYELYLAVNSNQIAGSYTQDDVNMKYSGLYHNDNYVGFYEVSDFTVTGNAKSCSTYVEILGRDNILYRINYSYTKQAIVPTDTVNITMDNAEFNAAYDQTYAGLFQLHGADQNDEYRMHMVIYSDQMANTYTQSDVEMTYSYLQHCTAGDTASIEIEEIRDFTVTGDEYACDAFIEIISTDSVLYRITYSYSYGIKDTINIVMDNKNNQVFDKTATDGNFMLVGADQAGEYLLVLLVESDQMAGTYGAADIVDYEFESISGTDTSFIQLERASIFTVDGDSTWCKTELVFVSADSVMYRITFEYGEVPVGVENTVGETEFVVYSESNTIVVYGVEGQMVAVYDMAGRTIMNGESTSDIKRIDVAVPGIYVVRVADRAVKVLVK